MESSILILCVLGLVQFSVSVPKKYEPGSNTGGFLPSSGNYYNPETTTVQSPEPRALLTSEKGNNESEKSSSDRIQRFGITGYGGAGGYPGTGGGVTPGVYAPLKLDLGGVVLGTLIGLGAVLILPKLAHVFSHGYGGGYGGGYGRSSDSTLNDLVENVETALEKYNIDSSSCMQRLVCNTVQGSKVNMAAGQSSSVDEWVQMLTTNPLFSSMLDGTAIKEAVDAGWGSNPNACDSFSPKCTVDKNKILQVISSMLPA